MSRQLFPCAALCLLGLLTGVEAASKSRRQEQPYDWPQWLGPARNGLSRESGLLKSWPKDGPPLVWNIHDLGGGYSSPSIAAGRIFGMSYRDSDEVVWALEESTGKELWNRKIAEANRNIARPGEEGSRCTPTIDGDRLFALGVSGDLVCLEVATGKVVWRRNLVKDFGGHIPAWGYSESPLIDGNRLVATPGGQAATMVVLNKKNGEPLIRSQVPQGDGANYSSVIAAEVEGQRQYIQFLGGGVVGVAAADGKFLWRYNEPSCGINCSTPIFSDNEVFAAASYGRGGGLVKLVRQADVTIAEKVYFTKHMKNHHGGMVLVDGYLYGSDEGELCCLKFKTGEIMWEDRKPGKGSITYADGHIIYRNEGGPIVLVEANPKKYVEKGRFNQPDRSSKAAWPHPVIANGKLYIRDQDVLLCYDLKQP